MTGMEHAIEHAAARFEFTDEEWREYQAIPDQGYSHRDWLNRRMRRKVEELAAAGLLAPTPLTGDVEEAYQRGHEDGYWNGKTTDMTPAQAAAFMAPYRSRCPGCADRTEGDGSADQ